MLRKPDRSRNETKLSLEWNTREEKEKEGHLVQIHSFFYKNLFYKNVEAEIDSDFKNILRMFLS